MALPDRRGWLRGAGRMLLEVEVVEEGGGERSDEWRKPPGAECGEGMTTVAKGMPGGADAENGTRSWLQNAWCQLLEDHRGNPM